MSGSLRGFHQSQRGDLNNRPLLQEISGLVEVAEGVDSSEELRQAARAVHLPVAALRGALSSYSEISADPTALRVCAGTSCLLAGGSRMLGQLVEKSRCHPVYCLGYCDRSPVAMTPEGRILARHGGAGQRQSGADPERLPLLDDKLVANSAKEMVSMTRRASGNCWPSDSLARCDPSCSPPHSSE